MMVKFAIVLLTEALVILPIVLGTRLHEYDSYKEYYNNRVNGGQLKPRTNASYEMTEKSYYDSNKDNSKHTKDSFNFAHVPHCEHLKQTFCENVPNYPQDYVNRMLAKNSSLLNYSFQDVIEFAPRLFDIEEVQLCVSAERVITPKTALNLKNEWMYILQSDEPKFRQRLRIEVCKQQNTKCKIVDDCAPAKYVTTCKQKYVIRELFAIKNGTIVVRDTFRIPASCSCRIEFRPSL